MQNESWALPVAISASVTRLLAEMTVFRDRQGKRQDLILAPVVIAGFDGNDGDKPKGLAV
jgi:hypothetical protein